MQDGKQMLLKREVMREVFSEMLEQRGGVFYVDLLKMGAQLFQPKELESGRGWRCTFQLFLVDLLSSQFQSQGCVGAALG